MGVNNKTKDSTAIGFLCGIIAYIQWGFLPLYWKLLNTVSSLEILAHRILWSFVFVIIILYLQKGIQDWKLVFTNRQNVIRILCATIFVSINWGVYIWAVNSNHIVEASMGYYINPLVVILLGVVILKEKLNIWQIISLILATIGVGIITFHYGQIPWISLVLAVSFALYGLMKKMVSVGSVVGLAVETAMLLPLTLGFLIYRQMIGVGAFGRVSLLTTLILMGAGVATASPLLFFAEGTRRIPLSSMGFLQYIAPSISLILGIFVYKEQFTYAHFISFGFIWIGLIIYSISQIKQFKNNQNRKHVPLATMQK